VVAVERYRKVQESALAEEAEKILKTFFDHESQLYINITDREERAVRSRAEKKEYSSDLFDTPYRDVMSQLDGILLLWKSTSEYQKVLTEANFRNSNELQKRESESIQLDTLQQIKLS